ncbi:gustatory receptor for sugar taste 64e-like [Pectinophora gossypiella]|uniref:gustatory receptor for sugar taste 64e-like n=1 Tax=Pectinophora gossypiella TaxID=13191 RepID=UPI00214E5BF1|nr:gustatory receptor for sugar taste 64e-like [Pectinophora gossypiella]
MCFLKLAKESNADLSANTSIIFYGTNCTTTIIFLRIAMKWPKLCQHICRMEAADPSIDGALIKKCNISCIVVLSLAAMEHVLADVSGIALAIDCQPDRNLYEAFILQSFPWIWTFFNYNPVLGFFAQVINFQCTFNWNFSDIFVICISWYLTARLQQINERVVAMKGKIVPASFWRTVREDYSKATDLVRRVDDVINCVIFISFANNLFFICLQLLHTLEPFRGYEQAAYFVFSLVFLMSRSLAVSLIAAQVHSASLEPAKSLYDVPSASYNVEVQRFLDQIHGDTVALSGLQFFKVKRGLVLTIAGTIVTYELVLMQFTGVTPTGTPPNFPQPIIPIFSTPKNKTKKIIMPILSLFVPEEYNDVKDIVSEIGKVPPNTLHEEYIAPSKKTTSPPATFQGAMKLTILIGQCFGLNPVLGICETDAGKLRFLIYSARCLYTLVSIAGQFWLFCLWVLKLIKETNVNFLANSSVVFYGTNCLTTILFLRMAMKWPQLCQHICRIEAADPNVDSSLVRKCNISCIVFVNIQCTFNWNFSDAFIICISWYLTARLQQVNERIVAMKGKIVPVSFWRTVREDYTIATDLVRKVDDVISGVIFLSYANNLYSICVQLLHTLEPFHGHEQAVYILYSLLFLLVRSTAMSLIAAQVHSASLEPAKALYDVPSTSYCIEVQRFLDQIHGDTVALTGLQFFNIKRGLILTIAGTIVTYELVLMQFTGVSPTTTVMDYTMIPVAVTPAP